jgi:hypothetical protein
MWFSTFGGEKSPGRVHLHASAPAFPLALQSPLWVIDVGTCNPDVRFTAKNGHRQPSQRCSFCANNGSDKPYSITSSAPARTDAGISIPSNFAVLRLMRSRNLVGCSIGSSAGLAPLRIRST